LLLLLLLLRFWMAGNVHQPQHTCKCCCWLHQQLLWLPIRIVCLVAHCAALCCLPP
jgi:hypothetical protein